MATSTTNSAVLGQVITFTSATTPPTVAASAQLTGLSPGNDTSSANSACPTQFIAFSAIHSDASGTATVVVFFADNDSVGSLGYGKYRQVTLTITATTTRTSHSTAAGGYVCTVVSSEPPLANTVDVHGAVAAETGWPRIYAGCTVISGGTLTLIARPGRAI